MENNEIIYFQNLLKENSKVEGDCLEWTGKLNPGGYGYIFAFKRIWQAHRISFLINTGFLPNDLYICHKCSNKKCIKIDHLYAGTAKDNYRDFCNSGKLALRTLRSNETRRKNKEKREQELKNHDFSLFSYIENIIDKKINEYFEKKGIT